MTIRKATTGDLGRLSILFDGYRIFYKQEADITGAELFLRNRMANNESEIFIAENEGNAIMGFVQLYPIFSSTRMKRFWLLNDLFVDPAFRGKGVSTALINECKNLCRQTNSCGMILETARDNIIGNNLYLKTGFLPDGNHYYYEWEIDQHRVLKDSYV